MELKPLAVPFLVPMFLVFFATLAVALALYSWRRRKVSQAQQAESIYSSTFLPPIVVDGNAPKEQTYIVSRSWKPPKEGNSVYAPLSVPIEESPSRNIFGSRGVLSQALQPEITKDVPIV